MISSNTIISAALVASTAFSTVHAAALVDRKLDLKTSLFAPTNYSVVSDIFIQDSPTFNATDYNALNASFGLIDQSKDRWRNFQKKIHQLNQESDDLTSYKVIYMARHGEGYHNQAQAFYGDAAWDCFFSQLNTDGNQTWGPDAHLTPAGILQAEAVNAAWKNESKWDIPLPQVLYSSPMTRSMDTLNITWHDILLNKGYVPQVKENWRETIGLHTCDKRSNKTAIAARHPGWDIEPSFTEQDQLWNPVYEETRVIQALRIQQMLNNIFATDDSTYISITAHSGVITAFFTAINHQAFHVQTGGVVPVVIKAVGHKNATQALITGGQSATAPKCTANPTTAVRSPATITVPVTWYPPSATSSASAVASAASVPASVSASTSTVKISSFTSAATATATKV
ncbi:Predicted phosphoglycerate mutase [Phaffia rhodozyma]|uniref:Predicted phosphoglycerate mutase n=1 Tax=Phaffia rhodozyma TaxID=264483 RepID=A0A0F7SRA8_PHARH|nr:Predicted phosphoglycerate mutase [Phaffia rhodozyma]